MSLVVQQQGDTLSVSGAIDFECAGAALTQGQVAIEATPSLTVDLSGVTQSNSAGLALLIEWTGIARRKGHSVSFTGVPQGLQQLAKVSQVDDLIAGI